MTGGHCVSQQYGRGKGTKSTGWFVLQTPVSPCPQVPDMNKRNWSRSKDKRENKTKQPFAVCASRLDLGLNKPDVEDLKANWGNLNID